MSAKSLARPTIFIVCIGLTALGLRNTYADNAAEKQLAEQTACGKPGCSLRMLSESRNAIGQTFAFQTEKLGAGTPESAAIVPVKCEREWMFIGDYRCAVAATP
jgi:hypothetical protein